jgi:sulfite reductase alpha subunit
MVAHPRTSSYARMDDWDEQADKWNQRKAKSAAAE